MKVEVVEERDTALLDYARIPITFEVREAYDVTEPREAGRFMLTPRAVAPPYMKNYDVDGASPKLWSRRFDLSFWGFFVARLNGVPVGGAAVVFGAPDVDLLAGRDDVSILWDIRVEPSARRLGVGATLLASVEAWSTARGAEWLEVETQNINVPACRFYAARGFALREVNREAYPLLPNEIQLLWHKPLGTLGSLHR